MSGGVMLRVLVAALVSLAWCAAAAVGQLSAGFSVASFQLDLSNPGARSLGMAGAFTGLADDATAAYANPAGLTLLLRPEVSFEGRTASFRLPLVAAEPVVNGGDLRELNLADGSTVRESAKLSGVAEAAALGSPDATGTTASFVSFVYPLRGWTLALYRHQLVDLEAAGGVALPEITTTLFESSPLAVTLSTTGTTATRARVEITGFGLSAARKIHDRLALGVTLVRSEAAIEALRTSAFEERRDNPPGTVTPLFESSVAGDGSDLTVNLGLLARPGPKWAVGLSFRQGPSFDLLESERTVRSAASAVGGQLASEPFRIPDVVSVGVSFKSTRRLVLSFEWDRVGYSKLRRIVAVPDSLSFGSAEAVDLSGLGSFRVDDANELRAGLELSFWDLKAAPALRFGVWHDPDHQVRFVPAPVCPGSVERAAGRFGCSVERTNPGGALAPGLVADLERRVYAATAAEALALLFPPGEDRLHLTGGVGVVLGSRLQIDAAIDYVSSDRYTASLSGVVQF